MTIRVLHLPTSVGNQAGPLAAAERAVGLDSRAIVFGQSPFGFAADETIGFPQSSAFGRLRARLNMLRRVLWQADVVHFNFGTSLLPVSGRGGPFALYDRFIANLDLPLLKSAGKVVAVTYQGDDARQGDYCRTHFAISTAHYADPGYYRPEQDAVKRRSISRFARHADLIYGLNPDLLHVLPTRASFLPYAIALPPLRPRAGTTRGQPVVVHAPTHRGVKGTAFVVDAVNRLKREGFDFEFVLIEEMSHAEAIAAYQRADLAIDQLLAGWYGMFAVEMMALGTPVICYLRDGDLGFLPDEQRAALPIIHAEPGTIAEVLRSWLTIRRQELPSIGMRGRIYVERWHDAAAVAQRLKCEYEAALAGRR